MTVAAAPQRATQRQQRQQRLLDAVAACLDRLGYTDTTVDAIVAAARTSKSAFYANFANKDEAVAALLDREGDRLLRAVDAAISTEANPARRTGAGIATFVRACAADERTARILLVEAVGTSPLVEARRRGLHGRFAALVRRQLEPPRRRGPAPARHAELDHDVLAFAIIGAVNEAVVHMLEGGGDAQTTIAALEHVIGSAVRR